MEELKYTLDTFEGPLDLLLTLIKKNKVSIWDIPIVEITDQYLEAIDGIEKSRLDDTSEFIVMASQLLYIKSKMLLPKDEEEEDEEDPREELARRLYEYKKFKEASLEMRKSEFSSKFMVFREEEPIKFPVPEYTRHHELSELADAFNSIYQRRIRRAKPEKRAFSGIVGREKVSVDDMVEKICKVLHRRNRVVFSSLFSEEDSRPEMIATFLAVLEMIKLRRIRADYDENRREFIISSGKDLMVS
ncbi:MAG: segregation/condensation protein A [Oscillospiraceae bacterium]|nr:segregation/condensation protein A [Oscillospiraceae bacterium]